MSGRVFNFVLFLYYKIVKGLVGFIRQLGSFPTDPVTILEPRNPLTDKKSNYGIWGSKIVKGSGRLGSELIFVSLSPAFGKVDIFFWKSSIKCQVGGWYKKLGFNKTKSQRKQVLQNK